MLKYLLTFLGLGYLIWPFDLAPDFIVGLGWIDDLALLALLWWFFFRRKGICLNNLFGRMSQAASGGAGGFGDKTSEGAGDRRFRNERLEKDPYTVLGLSRNASSGEIRKAYRELANRYHPDKVNHLGEEFRDLAEERFKEVQTAYQELTRQ
ncbi:MAG: DnaJ domain-containing protein [Deltaproteobacteria bacterium]|nr:DnaJ domain-containing protein [Deltaproteobacteria bacterium]MBW2284272.1 DnaJ domain-containing protein [Deltaproteobacteria bacterium]